MPVENVKLGSLKLHDTKLRTLELVGAWNLLSLSVKSCMNLVELHMPVEDLKLKSLQLYDTNLKTLDLVGAQNLVKLKVENCLVELHIPIEKFKLESLYLRGFELRTLDLTEAQNLISLNVVNCNNLVELHLPVENLNLDSLQLYNTNLKTLNLAGAQNLQSFALHKCALVDSNMSIESLRLRQLDLKYYKLTTLNLKSASNLECLNLQCYNLLEIHAPNICLKGDFKIVTQGNRCYRLHPILVNQGSPMLLAELHLTVRSKDIACELHPDKYLHELLFRCIYKEPLSSSAGNLHKRICVNLCTCTVVASFYESSCNLQCFEGSNLEVLAKLHQLECLEELNLVSRMAKHLPDNICMLKHHKFLKLISCELLEQLHEDLGRLECLEELHLTNCRSLRDIPNSICEMKCLKSFHIRRCILVEKLPKEIGSLICLRELTIDTALILTLLYLFLKF